MMSGIFSFFSKVWNIVTSKFNFIFIGSAVLWVITYYALLGAFPPWMIGFLSFLQGVCVILFVGCIIYSILNLESKIAKLGDQGVKV